MACFAQEPAKASSSDWPKPHAAPAWPWTSTRAEAGGAVTQPMYTSLQPANHEMPHPAHLIWHQNSSTAVSDKSLQSPVQASLLSSNGNHSGITKGQRNHHCHSLDRSREFAASAKRAQDEHQQGLGSTCSPAQITAYIKQEKQKTVESLQHSQPGFAILAFCSSMQHLHCTAGPQMNYINLSAVTTALAHVWTAAQLHHKFQEDDSKLRSSIEAVCQQSLTQLQPMMQDMDVQGISNIVWSSAKLGLDPDEYVPGMMDTLTTMFLQLIHASNMKRRPNDQNAANLVWALATMHHHHPAATNELLDCVCSPLQQSCAKSRCMAAPQSTSGCELTWAMAELQQSPKDSRFLDDLCKYMHSLLQSQDASARPNAQNIANFVRALAVLKHPPKDGRLLDGFCKYLHRLLHSRDTRARPTAQSIANTLWALAVLGHPLKDGWLLDHFCMFMQSLLQSRDTSAMLDHLVALCQAPGLQPTPQQTRTASWLVLSSASTYVKLKSRSC
ncbi:hypothetical protein ABBQ32_003730 [Trebouxia sp. C0010 RCD-2024]